MALKLQGWLLRVAGRQESLQARDEGREIGRRDEDPFNVEVADAMAVADEDDAVDLLLDVEIGAWNPLQGIHLA